MNARTLLSTKWVLSHLFVVAMVVLMTSLGFWQLRRLDDRRTDNEAIREATAAAAVTVEELLAASGDDAGTATAGDQAAAARALPAEHTPVIVTGSYQDELSFLVANRTFDSQPGYWLATPVRLDDGRLVVVARGWVPRGWVAGDDPRKVTNPSEVQLSGRAFASVDGGRVGSQVGAFAVVSRMDLSAVSEATGAEVVDVWVQLERQVPAAGELPIPVPRRVLDAGPHLAYAFQWFFFSAGTVVVYWLILRRRLRAHLSHPDQPAATPGASAPDERETPRPVAP